MLCQMRIFWPLCARKVEGVCHLLKIMTIISHVTVLMY